MALPREARQMQISDRVTSKQVEQGDAVGPLKRSAGAGGRACVVTGMGDRGLRYNALLWAQTSIRGGPLTRTQKRWRLVKRTQSITGCSKQLCAPGTASRVLQSPRRVRRVRCASRRGGCSKPLPEAFNYSSRRFAATAVVVGARRQSIAAGRNMDKGKVVLSRPNNTAQQRAMVCVQSPGACSVAREFGAGRQQVWRESLIEDASGAWQHDA
jgi:hypothetical protein